MITTPSRLVRIILSLAFIALSRLTAQPQYTITELPSFDGGETSCSAINDLGHVVGGQNIAGLNVTVLFKNGTISDITPPSGFIGGVSRINNNGVVVGTYVYDGSFYSHPFTWENGVFTDLDQGQGKFSYSVGVGINDSNHVVGGRDYAGVSTDKAVVWKDGGAFDLGISVRGAVATGINHAGKIIVNINYDDNKGTYINKSVLWYNGSETDIVSAYSTYSTDINNFGVVVGHKADMGSYNEGFRWEGGVLTELGTLGGNQCMPTAINDSGVIVGSSDIAGNPFDPYHAFIWTDGVMLDLNDLIDPGSGWLLTNAFDINAKGQIVGVGKLNGEERGFILTPLTFGVLNPTANDTWKVGVIDTIKWVGTSDVGYDIRFSTDGGATYELIATVDKNTTKYAWAAPDSLRSSDACKIKISDALDNSTEAVSEEFTLRAYDLMRRLPGNALEPFKPSLHGWSFANTNDPQTMWPQLWYQNFDYRLGIDPFTNNRYHYDFAPRTRARSEDFPDWELFVNVFGVDQCYHKTTFGGAPSRPKEIAMDIWGTTNGDWDGACYGFPTSTLLYFEQQSAFINQNTGIPAGQLLFNLPINDLYRKTVNKYFIAQGDATLADHYAVSEHTVTPRDVLEELRELFTDDNAVHKVLALNNLGTPRAHAVLPYHLVRDDAEPTRFKIMVYDCNDPGKNDSYVLLDSLNNTWEEFLDMGYDVAQYGMHLTLPITHSLQPPQHPSLSEDEGDVRSASGSPHSAGKTWVYVSDSSSIIFTNSSGDTTGYMNGNVFRQIPGSYVMIPPVAVHHPPTGYFLPDSNYTIIVQSFADSHYSFLAHDNAAVYKYEREGTNSSQVDQIQIGNGMTVTNPDPETKNILLKTIIPAGGNEHVFEINNLAIGQGSTVNMEKSGERSIAVLNSGSPATYNLLAQQLGDGVEIFYESNGIIFNNSAQHHIVIGQDSVPAVTILIDNNNDGSIDDSTTINGVTVGVAEYNPLHQPSSFRLFQNYPNPFNPLSVIGYQLPVISHVTLKVYDMLGREVQLLVDEEQSAGYKSVQFDAGGLPSGVYYCKMTAGVFTATQKMMLLK